MVEQISGWLSNFIGKTIQNLKLFKELFVQPFKTKIPGLYQRRNLQFKTMLETMYFNSKYLNYIYCTIIQLLKSGLFIFQIRHFSCISENF